MNDCHIVGIRTHDLQTMEQIENFSNAPLSLVAKIECLVDLPKFPQVVKFLSEFILQL